MWFKQCKIFQLNNAASLSTEGIIENLNLLAYQPCLPSLNVSIGWCSPVDEENGPLVRTINHCMMICLQIEEKILPGAVIKQELVKKIKQIEQTQDRKVRFKEKLSLKDEVTMTLLPRAFSKLIKIYGYIDIKNNWLVVGTNNAKKCEQFVSLFKKTITEEVKEFEIKNISYLLTHWVKQPHFSNVIAIEKTCFLQDSDHQQRTIRCCNQDLGSPGIQQLIKEGCEVKQLALSWQDRIEFILQDDFTLQGIKFQDEIKQQAKEMDPESVQQQFDVDFLIMGETIAALLIDLLNLLNQAGTNNMPFNNDKQPLAQTTE